MYYFFDFFFCFFFYYFFIFKILNNYSWFGSFIFCDSLVYVVLVFMCMFIILLVVSLDYEGVVTFLSIVLFLISILFFFSSSFFMLYIFYEMSIFPIMVMILGLGSQVEKVGAGYYLLFYTVFCSFPLLYIIFSSLGSLYFVYFFYYFSWEFVFILSLGFMVKFPVYFLHLWLPKAHVEAPTSASMILAGLLLKLGCIGMVRVLGSLNYMNIFFWFVISIFGMIFCSFSCMFQSDIKSLSAYSSVVHMSMFFMMILGLCNLSKSLGVTVLLGHGYVSVLMFYIVGEFYYKLKSRMIYYFNGFLGGGFFFLFIFIFIFLSNSGVPLSISFFCEFSYVVLLFSSYGMGYVLVGLYFFFSFYYSIYVISCGLLGSSGDYYGTFNFSFCISFFFMIYNFFWFSYIF